MSETITKTDPKTALVQLFQKAGIKKVAYIDDRFSIENLKEEFIGNLKSLKQERGSIPELKFIEWELPIRTFNKRLKDTWDELDNPRRYEYMQQIYKVQEKVEDLINIFPVVGLKAFIPEYLETFSPTEWEKAKDTFFAESLVDTSIKVLCLFDMDLNQATKNGIHYLIETLDDGKYFEQTYCAVFSHLITAGEEFTNKKEWCTTYSIQNNIAAKFYPISKSLFNNDDPVWGFIEGIKNVFIVEKVEKLKEQSIEIIKIAHKTVIEELGDLTPETYNHIVQRTSNKEGIWEMNTLFRVSNIIQDFAQKSTISNQEERLKFNSSITSIRSFDEVYIEGEPLRWSKQAKHLRDKEIFDNGEIINSLHFPLANGDIFQIGTRRYVLLAQPCNLSIRNSGNRDYDYDIASIVELVVERPKNPQFYVKVESEDLFIKFQSNYSLKLDVLDLAVYNNDGVCKIKSDQELPDRNLFHYPLELRYNKLKRYYLNCGNKIIALEDILASAHKLNQLESVLKPIITLNSALKGLPPKPFDRSTNEFNFGIKRVKRLKEPYSTDALQKFMLYLSRNGFDRDYTLKD